MNKSEKVVAITIMQCHRHGFRAVGLETLANIRSKSIGGLRITPSKCCGSWDDVQEWRVSLADFVADLQRLGILPKEKP